MLFVVSNASASTPLPKTGQTVSETRLDDGDLQLGISWPTPRFTDNEDGTLTDNLTGLMWIKDAFCANNFISGAATANWGKSVSFANTLNDHSLVTPCREYTANYEDWHTPNINELSSLVRAGLENNTSISEWLFMPEDQSAAFIDIGIVSNPIWSSTTDAGNTNNAWQINLQTGEIFSENKISTTQLAFIFSAVRSTENTIVIATGQSTSYTSNDDGQLKNGVKSPAPRFVATETGTVIDKLTGFMWLQNANCATPEGSDWLTASKSVIPGSIPNDIKTPFFESCIDSYTPIITEGFAEEWRIPNINELRSIIDYGNNSPAIDADHPFTLLTDKLFWSSTSSNTTIDSAAENNSWTVSLQTGDVFAASNKLDLAYTWPVRGPVDFPDIATDVKSLEFNNLFTKTQNEDKTLEITNPGKATLSIDFLKIVDQQNQEVTSNFTIGRDLCSERNLEAGASCTVFVNFNPESANKFLVNLKVRSNALGIPEFSIPISGTGLSATSTEGSNPSCFIATAAYGSFMQPEVKTLRIFRDEVLLKYELGKTFVRNYYAFSPPIANYLASNETLRTITRAMLTPLVYSINYPIITSFLLLILTSVLLHVRICRFRLRKLGF